MLHISTPKRGTFNSYPNEIVLVLILFLILKFQILVEENIANMYRLEFTLFTIFIAITLVAFVECEQKKLQIGVKKKVENCSRRSRKGDVLHMHYTVRYI